MRDNGSVEGGADGFAVGDKVIVVKKFDSEKYYVVAHEDGIMTCGGVELISAGLSYSGGYRIRTTGITKTSDLKPLTHKYTVFSDFFVMPNYLDLVAESCNTVHGKAANVSADNIFVTSLNHKDDWHNNSFFWTGFPYWNSEGPDPLPMEETWRHPGPGGGIAARPSYSHSWSTYIDGRAQKVHGINQEWRVYRPGLLNLLKGCAVGENGVTEATKYLITTLGPYIYGKRPYTRVDGRITTYRENLQLGGSFSPTITAPIPSNVNPAMFFWPFIPYLWEIPGFNVLLRDIKEPVYGTFMAPEGGVLNFWNFEYHTSPDGIQEGGSSISERYRDSGSYDAPDIVVTNHADAGPSYFTNPSGTYNVGSNQDGSWNFSVTKYAPIGTVGNLLDLHIKTVCSGSGSYKYEWDMAVTKNTNFPLNYYWSWSGVEAGWWPVGSYADHTAGSSLATSTYETHIAVTQELSFGDIVIEAGGGNLDYVCTGMETGDYSGDITAAVYENPLGPLPFWPHMSDWTTTGTRRDTWTIRGTSTRTLKVFEVLDYDSQTDFRMSDGSYVHAVAVVYKRITISHTLPRIIDLSRQNDDMGGGKAWNGLPFMYWTAYGGTDTCIASGTRKVEYVLYINIGGTVYTKVLETVNTAVNGTGVSCSGSRAYGITCKFSKGVLLVSYDKESSIETFIPGLFYDSPRNFEDWNENSLGTPFWQTDKRVIGIVDPVNGAELFDEQNPIPSEVYAVNYKGSV